MSLLLVVICHPNCHQYCLTGSLISQGIRVMEFLTGNEINVHSWEVLFLLAPKNQLVLWKQLIGFFHLPQKKLLKEILPFHVRTLYSQNPLLRTHHLESLRRVWSSSYWISVCCLTRMNTNGYWMFFLTGRRDMLSR